MIATRRGLLLASLAIVGAVGCAQAHPASRHGHQRPRRMRHHHIVPSRTVSGPAAYGYSARHPYGTLTGGGDGQPTCYYADGTPYDPDIIGGVNHVGAGGPAVNWDGFDPCGY